MATFTTGSGYFNLSTGLRSMIDDDYANFIDYDDETRFDLAAYMMTKGNSQEVDTPEFYAWTGELNPRTGACSTTTTLAAADVTLFVDDGTGVRIDDVLHFPVAGQDGEHCLVTALTSANNFTVVRMNTTATTIATTTAYVILGAASSETATSSIAATWMEPAKVINRVMIIRRAFQLTRTEIKTSVRTSQSRLQQKTEQCRLDFRLDLAHQMWFSISTISNTTVFTSKGINEQMANGSGVTITDAGGALAYADITATIEALAPFSTSRKYVVFHGELPLGSLADLGASSSFYRTSAKDNKFGFAGNTLVASDFEFLMKYERIFSVIGAPYNGYMYCLDMDTLTLHHLAGGKFQFEANIHADPGGEVVKSQYRAQVGLGVTWPKRNAVIRGVT